MTHAEAYKNRKQIIKDINRELRETPYSVELDNAWDRPIADRGIGMGCGYLKIRNGKDWHWASFDCSDREGKVTWTIAGSQFTSLWNTRAMAQTLVGKYVLDELEPTLRDLIDFDLLHEIKSRYGGMLESFDDTEEMIARIDREVPLGDQKDKLYRYIEREKAICRGENWGTQASMGISQIVPDGQTHIFFSVRCEAIKYDESKWNWHLQNTSQWLYAGAIVISRHDGKLSISSHH